MFRVKNIVIAIFLGLVSMETYAQRTIISGRVIDAETRDPVPFVNVGFMHSLVGTISEIDGTFYLSIRAGTEITDTLLISSIGYRTEKRYVSAGNTYEFSIDLIPERTMLSEVVVRPGINPAFRILDKISDNRNRNNPDRFESYQYRAYTRLRLDLNNIDDDFRNQRFLKDFGFIFDHMDSSEVFSKNYLPLIITESVSRFYYSKSPPARKELIEAFNISGFENNTLSQYSGKMYQELNIYDNFITFFDPGFVSPIADFGRLYYDYFLEDSATVNTSWCYKISFRPKRKFERTFHGYFWVADTSFAIQKFQLRVSADVNLNLVKDVIVENEYERINDTTWFLSSENMTIDFNIAERSYGFFGHKTAVYDQITVNAAIPDSIRDLPGDIYVQEEEMQQDPLFWETNRPGNLETEDSLVYVMVDSIKTVPAYKVLYGLGNMLTSRYLVLGPVEIGPYYTLISHNVIEGMRLRVGGRTSNRFSTKLMLGGHLAYGFKDDLPKYGTSFAYMFNTNPRIAMGASFYHDIRQLGKSENAFLDDNFMTSLLRRQPNYKLTMVDRYQAYFEREWVQGISNTLQFTYQTIYATDYVPFRIISPEGDSAVMNSLTSAEISLNTHFAWREKFLLGKFERVSLGTKYPVIDLNLTYGLPKFLHSEYEYFKAEVTIRDKIELNPAGHLRVRFTMGKVFGSLPYPLLKLHEGNETWAYDPMSFNMMNYYEFVSDAYIHLFAEHHFQGFFLNRIPLIRRLHLREVLGMNLLAGRIEEENLGVMAFPAGLNALDKPYYEASAGVENIFRLLRVDAVWRFSYLDHPNIQRFGVRIGMEFSF